jgi:glucan-binding YG repeat protein/beta-lactamase superfamily II metal-dependent hydrolase
LESNGHFAMVDSGEDTDYPKGNDPRYPFRPGIITDRGFEAQVIAYLKSVGVKKLDFYLGTHAHSDHIGSGDEILNAFPVDRLYLAEYKDSYILNGSGAFWDNQYVYDTLMAAAKKQGTEIIQDFSDPSNHLFSLGNMTIEIMNYERAKDSKGNILPVPDDNHNSLAVKVTAFDHIALLGGDMNNLPAEYDETKIASEIGGKIDLLKLCHHGNEGSNSTKFINTLSPEFAILTGKLLNLPDNTYNNVIAKSNQLYSTRWFKDSGALIANMTDSGITLTAPDDLVLTAYGYSSAKLVFFQNGKQIKKPNTWVTYNNNQYFIGSDNTLMTGWLNIDGTFYYFNSNAKMMTGIIEYNGRYFYLNPSNGKMAANSWINLNGQHYYAQQDGALAIGWKVINGHWYYFNDNGTMKTGTVKSNGKLYYLDKRTGIMQSTTGWIADSVTGLYYYGNEDDSLYTGWINLNGVWYYLNPEDGQMQTGWYRTGSGWYYSNSSGAMLTGWIHDGWHWYYMDQNGAMQTGWYHDGQNWYYMNQDGAMLTGWYQVNGVWYYSNSSGAMLTDWIYDGWDWYYLTESGSMAEGWALLRGHWYYLTPNNGSMALGWIYTNGIWYYAQPSGAIYTSTTQTINQTSYTFDSSGGCVNPY